MAIKIDSTQSASTAGKEKPKTIEIKDVTVISVSQRPLSQRNNFGYTLRVADKEGERYSIQVTQPIHLGLPPAPGTTLKSIKMMPVPEMENFFSSMHIEMTEPPMQSLAVVVMEKLLRRLESPRSQEVIRSALGNLSLIDIDEDSIREIFSAMKVPERLIDAHNEMIANLLTAALINSMEKASFPLTQISLTTRHDWPVRSGVWPGQLFQLADEERIASFLGGRILAQEVFTGNGKFYADDLLSPAAIDMVALLAAQHHGEASVLLSWLHGTTRNSVLTKAFLKTEQQRGKTVFSEDDIKKLAKFGVVDPVGVATRLGVLYDVTGNATEKQYTQQGTYQSASRLATWDRLPRHTHLDGVNINMDGLDASQQEAARVFMSDTPVMIMSGPPGTGKSKVTSLLIEAAYRSGYPVVVVTSVAKAASRLNSEFDKVFKVEIEEEKAVPQARTIHAFMYRAVASVFPLQDALSSKATEMFPTAVPRSVQYPYKVTDGVKILSHPDVVHHEICLPTLLSGAIVFLDEGSQPTQDLMALLGEMQPAKLVIAGDPKQLPPVGAGRPFHDWVELSQAGFQHPKVKFCELSVDHRATLQLASFTKQLRGGKIDRSRVSTVHSEEEILRQVGDLQKEEAAVVVFEKGTLPSLVESACQLALADALLPTAQHSNPFRCSFGYDQTVVPDTLLMSFTNQEVTAMANRMRDLLAVHQQRDLSLVSKLPHFDNLNVRDLSPGDVVMQTENDNTTFKVRHPQAGKSGFVSQINTKNGEAYLYVGGNIWLPLPDHERRDFAHGVSTLWEEVGLLDDILATAGVAGKDPKWHASIARQLIDIQEKGSDSASLSATNLLRMSLGETLLMPLSELSQAQSEWVPRRMFSVPSYPLRQTVDGIASYLEDLIDFGEGSQSAKNGRQNTIFADNKKWGAFVSRNRQVMSSFVSGNASTVHKAQGSQAQRSITVLQAPDDAEMALHHEETFYTGVTRAKQSSITFLAGANVDSLEKIWAEARHIKESMPSMIKQMVMGDLPALPPALSSVTTALPSSAQTGVVFPARDALTQMPHAGAFQFRSLMTDMGLPADISREHYYVQKKMSLPEPMATFGAHDGGANQSVRAAPSGVFLLGMAQQVDNLRRSDRHNDMENKRHLAEGVEAQKLSDNMADIDLSTLDLESLF